ncbi:MAG: histidine phosphatase family protein [Balneola sp.]|nr:histidine phosphatase family protein [Balneola sp.]MBO6649548.1 histidine phosphatase family protein [Balneola sp.]MBO6711365.1 histidine phosphatase family protein [Balneola sp.]MBO6801281.1 histidine phosphatase family protein [Balneola sp.]MBO6869301.1 histidine phosphatase family protein [Balneola sp.]
MKQLYIIRHGETKFNKSHLMQGRGINASLNDTGRKQADAISIYFKDKPVSKIVTSNLKRAKESAEPLCRLFNLKPEAYTELDEMDFGNLEGKSFDEVKSDLVHLHECWSSGKLETAPENGETPIQVYKRANLKVEEILKTSDEECIVFILHGRLIRILLSEWLGLGLKNMHQIEHQNGAINKLTWSENGFEAVELNVTSHLLF